MTNQILIGCDVGTSSTKAVAVDLNGKIIAQGTKSYGIIQKENNWAEQDPQVWMDAVISSIQQITEQIDESKVVGICLSALYGGTGVLCDEKMESIRPALIWMDRRAEQETEWLKETIGEQAIVDISGNGIDSYFGYTKLLWVKKHETENWKKIKCILPIHSYLIYKMTGSLTIDYSAAGNLGGIYDYKNGIWSEKMCEAMGIPIELLPTTFVKPDEVVGTLNEKFQSRLGFSHPVPICGGTVDCIASMLSAAVVEPGDNAAVLGTSLNWGFVHNTIPNDPNLVSMPYCIHATEWNYTYGGASTAGALPRWFVKNFIGEESAEVYEQLEREIAERAIGPGSNGLVMLPYFMGERTPIWDENATGVLFGLSLSHTKADMYRALLESVAYSLRHIMESMVQEKKAVKKIVLVGGGSKSLLWQQIFADVTGIEVYTPKNPIEAPLGDAYMAGVGLGLLADYKKMKDWIPFNEPVLPDEKAHEKYDGYYQLYKELYQNLKDTMKKRTELISDKWSI